MIWIDNENRFSIRRLYRVLSTLAAEELGHGASKDQGASDIAAACLRNLHVFRPQSSDALLATVEGLMQYLLNPNANSSFGHTIETILIENVSAFFWEDRYEKERQTYPLPSGAAVLELFDLAQRWKTLVTHLWQIQSTFGCVVAVSNTCLFSASILDSEPALRTNVPTLWSNFVTLELIVAKNPPMRFRSGLSAEEALLESKYRDDDLQKGTCTAWEARLVCTDRDPTPSILQSVGDGRFRFKIDNDGVMIYELNKRR